MGEHLSSMSPVDLPMARGPPSQATMLLSMLPPPMASASSTPLVHLFSTCLVVLARDPLSQATSLPLLPPPMASASSTPEAPPSSMYLVVSTHTPMENNF